MVTDWHVLKHESIPNTPHSWALITDEHRHPTDPQFTICRLPTEKLIEKDGNTWLFTKHNGTTYNGRTRDIGSAFYHAIEYNHEDWGKPWIRYEDNGIEYSNRILHCHGNFTQAQVKDLLDQSSFTLPAEKFPTMHPKLRALFLNMHEKPNQTNSQYLFNEEHSRIDDLSFYDIHGTQIINGVIGSHHSACHIGHLSISDTEVRLAGLAGVRDVLEYTKHESEACKQYMPKYLHTLTQAIGAPMELVDDPLRGHYYRWLLTEKKSRKIDDEDARPACLPPNITIKPNYGKLSKQTHVKEWTYTIPRNKDLSDHADRLQLWFYYDSITTADACKLFETFNLPITIEARPYKIQKWWGHQNVTVQISDLRRSWYDDRLNEYMNTRQYPVLRDLIACHPNEELHFDLYNGAKADGGVFHDNAITFHKDPLNERNMPTTKLKIHGENAPSQWNLLLPKTAIGYVSCWKNGYEDYDQYINNARDHLECMEKKGWTIEALENTDDKKLRNLWYPLHSDASHFVSWRESVSLSPDHDGYECGWRIFRISKPDDYK